MMNVNHLVKINLVRIKLYHSMNLLILHVKSMKILNPLNHDHQMFLRTMVQSHYFHSDIVVVVGGGGGGALLLLLIEHLQMVMMHEHDVEVV